MLSSTQWEDRHGALQGSVFLIKCLSEIKEVELSENSWREKVKEFMISRVLKGSFEALCKDQEYRVRKLLAEVIKEILAGNPEHRKECF
jgi:hypothetical protein